MCEISNGLTYLINIIEMINKYNLKNIDLLYYVRKK